jgi:hypothetical protein
MVQSPSTDLREKPLTAKIAKNYGKERKEKQKGTASRE